MSPDDLIREWAAADTAAVDAANAPDAPKLGTTAYREWLETTYTPIHNRHRAAVEALHAWASEHPATVAERCEHCGQGACPVCGRAA